MLNDLLSEFLGDIPSGFGLVEYLLCFFLLLFLLRFACLVVMSVINFATGKGR